MLGGSKISTGNKDRPVTTGSDTRLDKDGAVIGGRDGNSKL